eukprot:9458239-Pyramimonas_sp.AAC.2
MERQAAFSGASLRSAKCSIERSLGLRRDIPMGSASRKIPHPGVGPLESQGKPCQSQTPRTAVD